MTRTFFFLFLALASSANAATIRSYLGGTSNGTTIEDLPETFNGGIAFANDVDWIIPGLTVEDFDTVYTLDASTAASYGVTMETISDTVWQDRQDIYAKPFVKTSEGGHILGDVGSPNFSPWLNNTNTFEVISVEYRVRVAPHDQNRFLVEGWMTYVVPEPATFVLLLFGLCLLSHRIL